ncbi:MAG: hypothetical protein ACXWQO_12210 [Bdellovibrionota bacterium]
MRKAYWISLILLSLPIVAQAFVEEFTESRGKEHAGQAKTEYDNFKSKSVNQDKYYGGFRDLYRKFNEKIVVPGFISASPIPEVAKIVGPDIMGKSFRVGDTIYLRWNSAQTPKAGAIYSTYTPAIVTQNMANPTDFSVGLPLADASEHLPNEHRLAGYYFESTGRVRITKVDQNLVEGLLEGQTGQVQIGDHLMQPLPIHTAFKQSFGTIQLSAAIVSGSPPDRLSTSRGSFIYINRGSRDGIKVGQVFEAIERVELDSSANAAAPETSAGEAAIVYTTDSYSTAMITKQFDVIRMGSLLRTVNPANPTLSRAPFTGMSKEVAGTKKFSYPKADDSGEVPEVPSLDDHANEAPNLPDPMKKRPEPNLTPLSELDSLEKGLNLQGLSASEKARLSKLSRQERLGEKGSPGAAQEEEDTNPNAPGLENSFSKGKKPAKKAAKKKKQANDEEELNMLMMQN